jgi:chloramphenicol 3-O phosphotransferase
LPVLFVGVHCPIAVIMARRNADPQSGLYVGGDSVPAPVLRWQDAVHVPGIYDVTVESGAMSPDDCVAVIAEALATPKRPSAFEVLAGM